MDLTRTCRSCMKRMSSRAVKSKQNELIVGMFCYCINVKVSEEDKLPQQFCSNCVSKIKSSYTFITEAQKVDLTLRNLLSRVETSVIVELEQSNKTAGNNNVRSKEIKTENVGKIEILNSKPLVECEIPTMDLTEEQTSNIENYSDHFEEDYNWPESDESEAQNFVKSSGESNEIHIKRLSKKKYECITCSKKFASKIWFAKHMKKEHCQKTFPCKHCPKTFPIQSKWREHLMVHSEERNFSCTKCGNRYKRRKQLAQHMHNHEESSPFNCYICQKKFKRKDILLSHMMTHNDERKHLCSVCGMSFYNNSNLTTHMRIHTGEKPYACSECPKAFNTSSSFRRHERTHRGETPYSCATCSKAFTTLGSMKRHRRVHTGALPYQCPRCPHAAADSWKRKVHIMRAHGAALRDIPRLDRAGQRARLRGRPPGRPHALAAVPDD